VFDRLSMVVVVDCGGLAEEKIRAPAKIQIYRNLLDPKDTETIWI
jgi:hypothetical protein